MEVFSVLVTGANKGIGFEFVRQLAHSPKPPKHIFATYRNKNTIQKLEEVKKSVSSTVQLHLIKLDVRDISDLDNLKKFVEDTVGDKGLTLLINNAGVIQRMSFPNVTAENLNMHFQVNTIGPILVAQKFFPLLKKSASLSEMPGLCFSKAAILNMSSDSGSIEDTSFEITGDIDFPSYKISKVSLNMAMKVMALKLKEDNVLIVNMCPGVVKTDMSPEEDAISPEESISTMLNTISKLNEGHHGTFINSFGNPIKW